MWTMTYTTSPAATAASHVAHTRLALGLLLVVVACIGYVQQWDKALVSSISSKASGVKAKELLAESAAVRAEALELHMHPLAPAADDDDGGYGYAKGSALTPKQLGLTLLETSGDTPAAYENVDHALAEPADPDSHTGHASSGVLPWPEPKRQAEQSNGPSVSFKPHPFNDLHEYWAKPGNQQVYHRL